MASANLRKKPFIIERYDNRKYGFIAETDETPTRLYLQQTYGPGRYKVSDSDPDHEAELWVINAPPSQQPGGEYGTYSNGHASHAPSHTEDPDIARIMRDGFASLRHYRHESQPVQQAPDAFMVSAIAEIKLSLSSLRNELAQIRHFVAQQERRDGDLLGRIDQVVRSAVQNANDPVDSALRMVQLSDQIHGLRPLPEDGEDMNMTQMITSAIAGLAQAKAMQPGAPMQVPPGFEMPPQGMQPSMQAPQLVPAPEEDADDPYASITDEQRAKISVVADAIGITLETAYDFGRERGMDPEDLIEFGRQYMAQAASNE